MRSRLAPDEHPASSPSRPPLPSAALLCRRSSIAKPKSRFVEPPTHPDSSHLSPAHPTAAAAAGGGGGGSLTAIPTHRAATGPGAAAAAGVSTPAKADDDEDLFRRRDGGARVELGVLVLFLGLLGVLVLFLGLLMVSLLVPHLQGRVLWGLEIWKWCVMVIAVFLGHLLSQWLVTLVVFVHAHRLGGGGSE